jgi:hypothetical protein
VKGFAIFGQPTRGDSLDNFVQLLNSSSSSVTEKGWLVNCRWWSHSVMEEKHHLESISKYKEIYDESLHWPKILVLTKARDMIEEDRLGFIAQQKARPPSLCSKIL